MTVTETCLHYINADILNGEEVSLVDDMVVQPLEDNGIAIFFNGYAELSDIILSTDRKTKFKIFTSEEGQSFNLYKNEKDENVVSESLKLVNFMDVHIAFR